MKALTFVIAIFLSGCATLGGNHQLVAVDSDPRGASARLSGEKKPSGVTPFYMRLQRVPSETLIFDLDGKAQKVEVDCGFRWSVELIGNGVLAVLAPEAAIAGVLVDLATGSAFECPDAIMATFPGNAPSEGNPRNRYCRRFVVAPPPHIDSAMSERLVAVWREKAERALKGCDDFIPGAVAQNVFDFLGIGHRNLLTLDRLDAERLHYLGSETGATHLVVLDYDIVGDDIHFKPAVYDLYRGASVEMPGFALATAGGKRYDIAGGAWIAYWTFSVIPNSITYGFSESTFGVDGRGPWHVIKQEDPKRKLVDTVSKANLTTVEHPRAHGMWDYGIAAYPSLDLFSRSAIVTVQNDKTTEQRRREVSTQYAAPMYHLGVTGHTALGAVQAGVGAGSYFGRSKLGSASARYVTGSMAVAEATYTAFVTNMLFISGGIAQYRTFGSIGEHQEEIQPKRQFSEIYARAGYYFPSLRRKVRSAAGSFARE